MISSGEVKAPKTYKIGPYTFIDEDGNGKLSKADSVEVDLSKEEGGGTRQISASTFADISKATTCAELLGMKYAALKKNAKLFLPLAKSVAELMKEPQDYGELINRWEVKKIEPHGSITILVVGNNSDDTFKINMRHEFTIPIDDIGARRFLSAQGYRFLKNQDDPYLLKAIKDPEAAVREVKPYASDSEVREYLRRIPFVR